MTWKLWLNKIDTIEQTVGKKPAFRNAYLTCSMFLVFHIIYQIIFAFTKTSIIQYYNIFSLVFYCGMFWLIHFDKMRVYIRLAFMEVNIFCFIGLYCFGSGYGFEYLLFTIIVMFFYSGYFAKRLHKKLHVGWYAMISAFVLTFFHFHLIMRGSYYTLTEHWIQHLFFTFHSLGSVILIVVFLTELTNYVVKLERLILHQSVTDELTDINNRNGALDKFTDLQNTNQLNNYALLMLDIDDFKKFNDTYGHDCGDLALKTLAKHLNDFAGTTCAARWGGEEFIAFINTKNLPLEHVRDFLKLVSEDEIDYNGNKLHITVTIGISTYKKYTNLTDWVIEADRALYEGKDTGKNRIIIK